VKGRPIHFSHQHSGQSPVPLLSVTSTLLHKLKFICCRQEVYKISTSVQTGSNGNTSDFYSKGSRLEGCWGSSRFCSVCQANAWI